MGFHLVLLGKLHLLANSHTAAPLLASMVVPFVFRVVANIGIIQCNYSDLMYSLRLFVFQLTRITLDDDPANNQSQAIAGSGTGSRWGRALRLVSERVTQTWRRMELSHVEDEEALHHLSIITL